MLQTTTWLRLTQNHSRGKIFERFVAFSPHKT